LKDYITKIANISNEQIRKKYEIRQIEAIAIHGLWVNYLSIKKEIGTFYSKTKKERKKDRKKINHQPQLATSMVYHVGGGANKKAMPNNATDK